MKFTQSNLARISALATSNLMMAAEVIGILFHDPKGETLKYTLKEVAQKAFSASYEPLEEDRMGTNTAFLQSLIDKENDVLSKMNSQPVEDSSKGDLSGFMIVTSTSTKEVTEDDIAKAFALKEQEIRVAVLEYFKTWVVPYKAQARQEIIQRQTAATELAEAQAEIDDLEAILEQRQREKKLAMSDEDLEAALKAKKAQIEALKGIR
jgi:hypothetical protein